MKLDYNVNLENMFNSCKENSKKAQTESALRRFLADSRIACEVKFSGIVGTSYQYLLKAIKVNNYRVRVIKRGKRLFLLKNAE